ncbi:MAG: 50S ribosomal protein L21 [Dysgonamonadaceae bacterium]|jgi:large subunit ribosomal protein L21|nr:50S ribosomal protein L21 [Dysgonamonadaceae bacterium]
MYVIVEIQGQQFKVEKDQKLYVHRLEGETGAKVEFSKILLADNDGNVTVGAPVIEGAKVVAEIVEPLIKGEKVLVFHKKRRKGYRKLNGHRQQFSQIVIKDIQV